MAVKFKFIHFNTRSGFDSNVPNPELSSADGNEFYNYIVFIKDTQEIYTHGQFYSYDDTSIWEEIGGKVNISDFNALSQEVAENQEVSAAAFSDLYSKVDNFVSPNLEDYVTTESYELGLNGKQDLLVSGSNIKTFEGNSLLITGEETNISIDDFLVPESNALVREAQELSSDEILQVQTNLGIA